MKSVARNLDEDLRSVPQAPTSSEAATRLSADKDRRRRRGGREQRESLGRPKHNGVQSNYVVRLGHIHSCPTDSHELTFWKHFDFFHLSVYLWENHFSVVTHPSSRRDSHLLVEASLAALEASSRASRMAEPCAPFATRSQSWLRTKTRWTAPTCSSFTKGGAELWSSSAQSASEA